MYTVFKYYPAEVACCLNQNISTWGKDFQRKPNIGDLQQGHQDNSPSWSVLNQCPGMVIVMVVEPSFQMICENWDKRLW